MMLAVLSALVLLALAGCGSSDGTPSDAGDAGATSNCLTVDESSSPLTACMAEGDTCEGGRCLREPSSDGCIRNACYRECDLIGAECQGGSCYYAGNLGNFCMANGNKNPDEACSAANDCIPGSICFSVNEGGICILPCTDACEEGDCTDTELGFKVCVEEA
jgi:hypothetical protein